MQLLAADATTLAPAQDPPTICLIKTNFTPAESLTVSDITLADFGGSTPIPCATGTQNEGLDPATNNAVISMRGPIGGFRFETTNTANLPQTIFGFCLTNSNQTVLYGAATFDAPVELTTVNQFVDVENADFTQLAGSIE